MEDHIHDVKESIQRAVWASIENIDRIGILFSGGLDSSLLAHLVKLKLQSKDITLYTVGTPESWDIQNAQSAARLLELNLETILINANDITFSLPDLSRIIGSQHPVKLSYELPLYLGMARIDEKHVMSGQGADELFGGYARYLKMTEDELENALISDLKMLISQDIKMDIRVAQHFDRTLITPYLHDIVVESAQAVPPKYKVSNDQRKVILKDAAIALDLPREIAIRQKKAVQYSSGIIKELRNMARIKKMEVNELLEHIISKNPL